MVNRLLDCAKTAIDESGIDLPSDEEATRIGLRLRLVVPAQDIRGLPDLLNAAWAAFEDADLWKEAANLAGSRDRILRELVLKNIEVFEIEQIQRDAQ
jgi:hypothetical protein